MVAVLFDFDLCHPGPSQWYIAPHRIKRAISELSFEIVMSQISTIICLCDIPHRNISPLLSNKLDAIFHAFALQDGQHVLSQDATGFL